MVNSKKQRYMSNIGKLYLGILLAIFGGIVFHAPLSVGLGVLFPSFELLIKSWKEILMLVAGVLLLVILYQEKKYYLLKDKLIGLIFLYALLHLGLLFVNNGLQASLAGLAIDLRYVFYFSLVYMAVRLYPGCKDWFIKTAIGGALVVLVFALLQIFVLPVDVLKYIGYGDSTIAPYLTVDLNESFVRINSTLRGPNPLGAYAVIVFAGLGAYVFKNSIPKLNKHRLLMGVLAVGAMMALWSSYSRSAVLGMIVAGVVVAIVGFGRNRSLIGVIKKHWKYLVWLATAGVVVLAMLFSNQAFISNVLLHENPDDDNSLNSNEGHVASLGEGFDLTISNPLGSGVGSTGSASLFTDNPLIIENQYLFIAHESGWLGLALFVTIFVVVMRLLWAKRLEWLALGLFASGVGLAVIGILLPVWVDDTVSIIWWGLAAIVVGSRWYIVDVRDKNKTKVKHDK